MSQLVARFFRGQRVSKKELAVRFPGMYEAIFKREPTRQYRRRDAKKADAAPSESLQQYATE